MMSMPVFFLITQCLLRDNGQISVSFSGIETGSSVVCIGFTHTREPKGHRIPSELKPFSITTRDITVGLEWQEFLYTEPLNVVKNNYYDYPKCRDDPSHAYLTRRLQLSSVTQSLLPFPEGLCDVFVLYSLYSVSGISSANFTYLSKCVIRTFI